MDYIIGLVIGIPLFILVVNFFYFKGNNPKETEINNYIQNSKKDTIILPKNAETINEQYLVGLSRRSRPSAVLKKYLFFNETTKKHYSLLIFKGFDSNSTMRWWALGNKNEGDIISILINKAQLNNPKYGTKENPVPVFPIDLILPAEESSWEARGFKEDPFHVSDELNKIFIEQYLKFFMPKEEFKETFRK